MRFPNYCDTFWRNCISKCWSHDPLHRPDMTGIVDSICKLRGTAEESMDVIEDVLDELNENQQSHSKTSEVYDAFITQRLIAVANNGCSAEVYLLIDELLSNGQHLDCRDEVSLYRYLWSSCRSLTGQIILQYGYTAIMRAARNGHGDIVKKLLEVGSDLEVADIVSSDKRAIITNF